MYLFGVVVVCLSVIVKGLDGVYFCQSAKKKKTITSIDENISRPGGLIKRTAGSFVIPNIPRIVVPSAEIRHQARQGGHSAPKKRMKSTRVEFTNERLAKSHPYATRFGVSSAPIEHASSIKKKKI